MSNTVIKVENLSKQYRLGQVGTGSLSHDINRLWHRIRGNEDPYLKIGEENIREFKGNSEYIWALKNINFEIQQGDRIGIIGRNGAGKSTLLKILSRTTSPTTGSVKIKGRVASLLEVGTGFHPDLSGTDNIFLNGAILGMSKRDIKSRFDEIVDFAGVERYIDTPVKRYSSGMYVRLAFAVAAHLESDILIVDEVLAVGDAEFQKKCLGKMGDVSKGEGRTVLFVSHNMAAIETLCNTAIYLNDGSFQSSGSTTKVIKDYLEKGSVENRTINYQDIKEAIGNDAIRIFYASVENASTINKNDIIEINSEIDIRFKLINLTGKDKISVGFDLLTITGITLFGSGGKFNCKKGELVELVCRIPANFLNDETYQIHAYFHTDAMSILFSDRELLTFEVKDIKRETGYLGKINGLIRPSLTWSINANK